jgi:hypothetical protein
MRTGYQNVFAVYVIHSTLQGINPQLIKEIKAISVPRSINIKNSILKLKKHKKQTINLP